MPKVFFQEKDNIYEFEDIDDYSKQLKVNFITEDEFNKLKKYYDDMYFEFLSNNKSVSLEKQNNDKDKNKPKVK